MHSPTLNIYSGGNTGYISCIYDLIIKKGPSPTKIVWVNVFDKVMWCTIGPKSILLGVTRFTLWAR